MCRSIREAEGVYLFNYLIAVSRMILCMTAILHRGERQEAGRRREQIFQINVGIGNIFRQPSSWPQQIYNIPSSLFYSTSSMHVLYCLSLLLLPIISAMSLPRNIRPDTIVSSSNLAISYVESCGCDANTEDEPVTLFIHGLDSSSHTWRNVQQSISSPSIAIDCRGCGKSDLGDPDDFTPDALVADVKCCRCSSIAAKETFCSSRS